MEWVLTIRNTINYIEDNLLDDLSIDKISKEVGVSPFYLQKGFSIATGVSISEYIKSRRLSLSAKELLETNISIIDLSLKYGYETPESFTKAFIRFHGVSPSKMRKENLPYKTFHRLVMDLVIKGGNNMDYKIVKLFGFKVIGFQKVFTSKEAYEEIPKYWDEICAKYSTRIYQGLPAENDYEQAIMDNCIGEYAVCIDDLGEDKFRYLIAGRYTGGKVPEGMVVYEFPFTEWAIFDCYGPLPEALQSVNTKIFKEWLPNNPEFEFAGQASIEWYDCINGEKEDPNYHSQIWIPVKRK